MGAIWAIQASKQNAATGLSLTATRSVHWIEPLPKFRYYIFELIRFKLTRTNSLATKSNPNRSAAVAMFTLCAECVAQIFERFAVQKFSSSLRPAIAASGSKRETLLVKKNFFQHSKIAGLSDWGLAAKVNPLSLVQLAHSLMNQKEKTTFSKRLSKAFNGPLLLFFSNLFAAGQVLIHKFVAY